MHTKWYILEDVYLWTSDKCHMLQAGYILTSKIRLICALRLYLNWSAQRPLASVII